MWPVGHLVMITALEVGPVLIGVCYTNRPTEQTHSNTVHYIQILTASATSMSGLRDFLIQCTASVQYKDRIVCNLGGKKYIQLDLPYVCTDVYLINFTFSL